MNMKSNPYLTILTIIFGLLFINIFLQIEEIIYICLALSAIGVTSFKLSKIIERLWITLSLILSKIVPNILLGLIFYLILTPLSILSKIFKYNSGYISKNKSDSLFLENKRSFDPKSFLRTW